MVWPTQSGWARPVPPDRVARLPPAHAATDLAVIARITPRHARPGGQIDVFPSERRSVGQEFGRDIEAGVLPDENSLAELQRVPVDRVPTRSVQKYTPSGRPEPSGSGRARPRRTSRDRHASDRGRDSYQSGAHHGTSHCGRGVGIAGRESHAEPATLLPTLRRPRAVRSSYSPNPNVTLSVRRLVMRNCTSGATNQVRSGLQSRTVSGRKAAEARRIGRAGQCAKGYRHHSCCDTR